MRLFISVLATLLCSTAYSHGEATSGPKKANRHINFPDTELHYTLVVDLHTHSTFSDGHVWPTIRISEALRDGLDAIAITEHLEWQPHLADIPHPDRNRAYEIAAQAAADQTLIVIAGSEITREAPAGHMNAVFISDANELFEETAPTIDAYNTRAYYNDTGLWPAQDAVEAANEQGGFVFWNHPYWTPQTPNGKAKIPEFHINNADQGLLHGIEIVNGSTYSEEAFEIALNHDLTLIGVSDVHDLIEWDYEPYNGGHRPVTLVMAQSRSEKGVKDALFSGRTVIWFKNLLFGREESLRPLVEAAISVTAAHYLPESDVLRVEVSNSSDATFILQNSTQMTFMNWHDTIEVHANSTSIIDVKPGSRQSSVKLKFDVSNALIAPKKPLVIEWLVQPQHQ